MFFTFSNLFLFFIIFDIQSVISFNPYIIETICPIQLRTTLNRELNKKTNKIAWKTAKSILHNEINNINIYGESKCLNVEHTFPQCLFNDHIRKCEMKTDLHSLFLSSTKINSYRKNYKYIGPPDLQLLNDKEIDSFDAINQYGEKIEHLHEYIHYQDKVMLLSKKHKLFVPSKYSRGKISRALAYFAVKYDYIHILPSVIDIDTLILWNIQYPVDKDEYLKNIITSKYQNTHNPFVIHPELVIYSFSDFINSDYSVFEDNKNTVHAVNYLIEEIKENDVTVNTLLKLINRKRK